MTADECITCGCFDSTLSWCRDTSCWTTLYRAFVIQNQFQLNVNSPHILANIDAIAETEFNTGTVEATENCNSGVTKLAHTEVNDDWRQATSKWKQTSIGFVTGQCSSNPTQDYFTQWRKLSWGLFREVADHERVWDGHEYQQQARRSSVRRVEAMCW